jgi:hypothetical protein
VGGHLGSGKPACARVGAHAIGRAARVLAPQAEHCYQLLRVHCHQCAVPSRMRRCQWR